MNLNTARCSTDDVIRDHSFFEGSSVGEEAFALAYATSTDGLTWHKPILNLVEEDGSTANNLVWPFYRWSGGHGVMKDPSEVDPNKRYKMLFTLCTKGEHGRLRTAFLAGLSLHADVPPVDTSCPFLVHT